MLPDQPPFQEGDQPQPGGGGQPRGGGRNPRQQRHGGQSRYSPYQLRQFIAELHSLNPGGGAIAYFMALPEAQQTLWVLANNAAALVAQLLRQQRAQQSPSPPGPNPQVAAARQGKFDALIGAIAAQSDAAALAAQLLALPPDQFVQVATMGAAGLYSLRGIIAAAAAAQAADQAAQQQRQQAAQARWQTVGNVAATAVGGVTGIVVLVAGLIAQLAGLAVPVVLHIMLPALLVLILLPILQITVYAFPWLGVPMVVIVCGLLCYGLGLIFNDVAAWQIWLGVIASAMALILALAAPVAFHAFLLLVEIAALISLIGVFAIFPGGRRWLAGGIAAFASLALLLMLGSVSGASGPIVVVAILAGITIPFAWASRNWWFRLGTPALGLVCLGAIVAAFYPVWRGGVFAISGYDPGSSVAAASFVNRQSKPVFGAVSLEGHDGKQHAYRPTLLRLWQSFRSSRSDGNQKEVQAALPPQVAAASRF